MANGIAIGHLTGNITSDPNQISDKLLTFSIAVNSREKNRDTDEWEDVADFFDIKVLGSRAAALGNILTKGMQVSLVGRIKQEHWKDKETGGNRSAVRIIAQEIVLPQRGDTSDGGEMRDDAADLF